MTPSPLDCPYPCTARVTCPMGLEPLLLQELERLWPLIGYQPPSLTRLTQGGGQLQADLAHLYAICLWSRIGNRVLLQLGCAEVQDKQSLRQWLLSLPWAEHLQPQHSFKVRFHGQLADIDHSHYGALWVKDAIVDYFYQRQQLRPNVDIEQPDLQFVLYLRKQQASVYLDLSGHSLHKRGYRQGLTAAPLKENLAAALLMRANWYDIARTGGGLIDPLCGSGTLLTEAALMACQVAPGLYRQRFGFSCWLQHQPAVWSSLQHQAHQLKSTDCPPIQGYDQDPQAVGVARQHVQALGLGDAPIRVQCCALSDWRCEQRQSGLLISNPPYGQRLQQDDHWQALYQSIGQRWTQQCPQWQGAILTANAQLMKATRLYWHKTYAIKNGALACQLYTLDLARGLKPPLPAQSDKQPVLPETIVAAAQPDIDTTALVRRLRKNCQRLKGWRIQHNIQCYRVYDADLPEFAVAIDVYGPWLHVQEYQAPAHIDPAKSLQRLQAILHCLPQAMAVEADKIVLKRRAPQRGRTQYGKQDDQQRAFLVTEGPAQFWVNLHDYLDTGLFLDHRPLRLSLGQQVQGQRLLNLYCYTASLTVQAALGGARQSVSVDLSNSYLDWAQRNFEVNQLDLQQHQLVRADVRQWLEDYDGPAFDWVFMDPPTFSNSKRTQTDLVIQRDHAQLIRLAMRQVAPAGVLVFSNNYRRFVLDEQIAQDFQVSDITDRTLARDFAPTSHGTPIHRCFEIRHVDDSRVQ